jgi:hypothetical protein
VLKTEVPLGQKQQSHGLVLKKRCIEGNNNRGEEITNEKIIMKTPQSRAGEYEGRRNHTGEFDKDFWRWSI